MKLIISVAALASVAATVAQAEFDVLEIRKYQSHQLLRGIHAEEAKEHFHWEGQDEDASSGATQVVYADALKKDTQDFIHDVHKWVVDAVGKKNGEEMVLRSQFTLRTKGEPSLVDEPCGEPVAHRAFEVLEKFVKKPKDSKLKEKDIKHITWHPSKECLYRHDSKQVDGGSHVNVVMSCGDEELLLASVAAGGITKKVFWKNIELSGAFVGVDIMNGTIKAVAASGNITPDFKMRLVPDDYKHAMRTFHRNIRQCADEKKLVVKGVVGGGWRQEYSYYGSFSGPSMTYVLGYADAFELSFEDESTPAPTETVMPPTIEPSVSPDSTTEEPSSDSPASTTPETEVPITTGPVTMGSGSDDSYADSSETEEPNADVPTTDSSSSAAHDDKDDMSSASDSEGEIEEPVDNSDASSSASSFTASSDSVDIDDDSSMEGIIDETDAPITRSPTTAPPATSEPPMYSSDSSTSSDDMSEISDSSMDGSDGIIEVPSADASGPMPDSTADFMAADVKELSELTSNMYFQSGIQCSGTVSEQSCLMQSAFSKIGHGQFDNVDLQMTETTEYPAPRSIPFAAVPVALLVAGVVVAGLAHLRTNLRRNGYQRIPSTV